MSPALNRCRHGVSESDYEDHSAVCSGKYEQVPRRSGSRRPLALIWREDRTRPRRALRLRPRCGWLGRTGWQVKAVDQSAAMLEARRIPAACRSVGWDGLPKLERFGRVSARALHWWMLSAVWSHVPWQEQARSAADLGGLRRRGNRQLDDRTGAAEAREGDFP